MCVRCLPMCMYVVCVCGVCGEGMWNVVYVEICMWYVRVCVSEWEVCGKDTLFLIQKSSRADHYTTNRKNSCCSHKSFPGGSQPPGFWGQHCRQPLHHPAPLTPSTFWALGIRGSGTPGSGCEGSEVCMVKTFSLT